MKAHGYTVNELVKMTGKSYSTIYKILKRNPNRSLDYIKNCERKYNCRKYFVDGVPLKEFCKTFSEYQCVIHQIKKNGKTLEQALLYKGYKGLTNIIE